MLDCPPIIPYLVFEEIWVMMGFLGMLVLYTITTFLLFNLKRVKVSCVRGEIAVGCHYCPCPPCP